MRMNLPSLIGYPLFIVALLEMALGMLLLINNPRNSRVHKSVAAFSLVAAAFALITALMYVLASWGGDVTPLARASWIGWLMIPAAVQFVFYLRDENSSTARTAGWVLYPFWIIVIAISVSTDLTEQGHYSLLPHLDQSGILGKPLRVVGTVQISWIIVEVFRLRRQMKGLRRAQLNYFTSGLLIFIVGSALVSGVLQLFGGFGLDPCLGSYFSLPWVLLTFYAMTNHRLFDVGSILSQTLTVALSLVMFVLLQTALFGLFKPMMGDAMAIAVSLPCIGLLFFVGTSLSRRFRKNFRSIIFQSRLDHQRALGESIRAMGTILDLAELLDFIISGIRTNLGVEQVCLYLKGKDGWYRRRAGCEGAAEERKQEILSGDVIARIGQSTAAMVREELEGNLSDVAFGDMNAWMKKEGAEVITPLFSKGTMRGILALGPKRSGEPYVYSDIEFLETLAVHAAVAIENALLYEEARHVKESLEGSELKFRTLAQTTPAAIFIHRGDRLLFTNRTAETMSGYSQDELSTMNFWDLVHPDFQEMVQSRGIQRLHDGPVPGQYEFKVVRKDGAERWALMTASRLDYEGGPAVIGTLFDITERKALEGRIRYAQKMEAIGKLAAGVAHDFNNVLTTVVGYANLLHKRIDKGDDTGHNHVDRILDAAERASSLTQTLLSFSRKQAVSMAPTDLGDIVRRMEKLLAGLVRGAAALSVHPSGELLPILGDGNQLERVVMNLLVNARDATPKGGSVAITTGATELDTEFIRTYGYGQAGPYAYVTVTDTGIGIAQAIREKMFEPFFTTKGPDKGTGLGLSIVYDIVKEHRGYITVDSEPGKGSTFSVYLPLVRDGVVAAVAVTPEKSVSAGRTILVAENEDDVREFIKAVLEGCGYAVIEARDGEEACARFSSARRGAIDLVLLDIVMPKMTGNEVYQFISAQQPGLKVIFSSGYQETAIREKGLITGGQAFLSKPFTKNELLATVQAVLIPLQDSVFR